MLYTEPYGSVFVGRLRRQAIVRFSEANPYGVLDHWVIVEGKPEVYIPLRMLANGDGTEVELILFRQPEMSDADVERDKGLIEKDLAALKQLLEGNGVGVIPPSPTADLANLAR
jgi:hypothetical protein